MSMFDFIEFKTPTIAAMTGSAQTKSLMCEMAIVVVDDEGFLHCDQADLSTYTGEIRSNGKPDWVALVRRGRVLLVERRGDDGARATWEFGDWK